MQRGVRFVAGAHRVVQGNEVSRTVSVDPGGVRCNAAVRYQAGKVQNLPSVTAGGGRATWNWKVERSTVPGPARAFVACGPAGRASRTFIPGRETRSTSRCSSTSSCRTTV